MDNAILDFTAAATELPGVDLHSLVVDSGGATVARHGWAPYAPSRPHMLYSMSKSFTSTALGFAVTEGSVDLDATVLSYFPEWDAEVTDERSRAIKVRHVAAMASGHAGERIMEAWKAGDGDLLLGLLRLPPEHDPGTFFAYNQPCTYALSAIVQKVSGQRLTDYLRPRLYEPLGIAEHSWRHDRGGRDLGYAGLFTSTDALARFGRFYLDEGVWEGRRLLPAAWIAEATRVHIPTAQGSPDWDLGYGFQFWRSRHGYRGDGAYGQFTLILPEQDAVVAITAQCAETQPLLDAVWEHLVPWLGKAPVAAAELPPAALRGPEGSGPRGSITAGSFGAASGNKLPSLRTVEVDARGGQPVSLTLIDQGDPLVVPLGEPGRWTVTGPVAAAHAWRDGTLHAHVILLDTPHGLDLVLDPAERTFTAVWRTEPLDAPPLSKLRMPN